MQGSTLLFATIVCGAALGLACGNQDESGADEVWDQIQADDYRTWARAPGFPGRTPSSASHGDEVEIFINDVIVEAFGGGAVSAWPEGSVIVKDGYKGGEHNLVAVMEKRADGWFWAEYDEDGGVLFSGSPGLCRRCHDAGADYVRAFELPQGSSL